MIDVVVISNINLFHSHSQIGNEPLRKEISYKKEMIVKRFNDKIVKNGFEIIEV